MSLESQAPPYSKFKGFLFLFRPNRTFMVAIITLSGAFAAGASWPIALWMLVGGWFLAVGGFALDFYADRNLDKTGTRARIRRNPIANGSISPKVGLGFSIAFIILSLITIILLSLWALIPWILVVVILIGLAAHWFETPFTRASTLGALQAFYLIMGALAGTLNLAIWLIALMFFFAMFAGRGVTDIRDFPVDDPTPVQTLPKRFGIARTAQLSAACLAIAYILSFLAYLTGEFSPIYLYLDILFIVLGGIFTAYFLYRPTPELAERITMVYMMGEGTLICLAIILGSVL